MISVHISNLKFSDIDFDSNIALFFHFIIHFDCGKKLNGTCHFKCKHKPKFKHRGQNC